MLGFNLASLTTLALVAISMPSDAHVAAKDNAYASVCRTSQSLQLLYACFRSEDGKAVTGKDDGYAAGIAYNDDDDRDFAVIFEGAQSWARFSTSSHQISTKVTDAGPKACIEYTITPSGAKKTHCLGDAPITIPGK